MADGCAGSGASASELDPVVDWQCLADPNVAAPQYLQRIGCQNDYQALASRPLDAVVPGAYSLKLLLDRAGNDALYFQNSAEYAVHWDFASKHLSGGSSLPVVDPLSNFNATEYYTLGRRFLLGAVAHYEEPDVWALEIAPYDTATSEMVQKLCRAVRRATYFGPRLVFHPTSSAVEMTAKSLPTGVPVMTTRQLMAKIAYQPLTLGTAKGQLRFLTAGELATTQVETRDILVLDGAPDQIGVVSGLITEELQTPLSELNLSCQSRGTPNMGLRGAMTNPALRALEGHWVRLDVGGFRWSITEISEAEANAWRESVKPTPLELPAYDVSVRDLEDLATVVNAGVSPEQGIEASTAAFGGTASRYSVLATTAGIHVSPAFAVPVYYYDQFMRQHGFLDRVNALLTDPSFMGDLAVRDQRLAELRGDMREASLDPAFEDLLRVKLAASLPGVAMVSLRASSTHDALDGFGAAGLYPSLVADAADWPSVLAAVREVWSSAWTLRAFEERSYRGVAQTSLGMALLIQQASVGATANGAALTGNPFDPRGLEPGYYLNAQRGDVSVSKPARGVSADEVLYFHEYTNQPVSFLGYSSLVPEGEVVLTRLQTYRLGEALTAIHQRFRTAYQPPGFGWYAMEVEFKLFAEGIAEPRIVFDSARPHPGRGKDPLGD